MIALKRALKDSGVLSSDSITDLNKKLKGVRFIIVDGTEQHKNRPKDTEKQKDYYSGKKNAIQQSTYAFLIEILRSYTHQLIILKRYMIKR